MISSFGGHFIMLRKKKKDTGLVFEFGGEAEKQLNFGIFMKHLHKKENIASSGGTYFIDSTFNITNEKHKALNLVLIDNNFES